MVRHRSIRTLAKAALAVAILFGPVFLLTPNREAQALSFVGSGTIIDSETQINGTSSRYWARIACDPKEVRRHIEMPTFPLNSPGLPRIQDRFSDGYMKWPSNFGDYSKDWKEFGIRIGRWAIVAFNDKGADEVLFMTWSD